MDESNSNLFNESVEKEELSKVKRNVNPTAKKPSIMKIYRPDEAVEAPLVEVRARLLPKE